MKYFDSQYDNYDFYNELGLISGVEIHQQLLTDKKLFCHCPAGRYTHEHDAKILRHMRPTLSELGEYDGTALMEFKTKKEIIYLLNKELVCTYEMDDTPPFLINQDALDIAIEIALMVNCNIVDEMHVARKQYLDGSIPAGFQRTAIVGVEGWVPYKDRKIRIIQLGFEEDSCREVSDVGHTITFNMDRLGIPLIEAVTYPDMRTPNEVAEVIHLLGKVTRTTQKVRRGIGSVRQDVNVSISGGTRVEIKGVPKIGWVPALVHNEALRQKALLEIRELIKRNHVYDANSLKTEDKDITNLMKNTKHPVLREAIKKGLSIRGIKIYGLKEILNFQTQPGLTFADEIAGRVRVIACLDQYPIIMHTERWEQYQDYTKDLNRLKQHFNIGTNDAVIICWGPKEDTVTGTNEIRLRIEEAIVGVPNETRQPFDNGTTDFERILPGPDRMYPDTDHPPTKIEPKRVDAIRSKMFLEPWEREAKYREHGLPVDSINALVVSHFAGLYDRIDEQLNVDMKLVGTTLTHDIKCIRRKNKSVDKVSHDKLFRIFKLLQDKQIYKEAIPMLIEELSDSSEKRVEDIIDEKKLKTIDEKELKTIVNDTLNAEWKEPKRKRNNTENNKRNYYIGLVMNKVRGMADASAISSLVEQSLN